MMPLFRHELKRLRKHPLPWILLATMILGALLTWQSLAANDSLGMKESMDPIARYRLWLEQDPDLKEREAAILDIEAALEDPDLSEEQRLLLEEQRRSHLELVTGGYLDEWYDERYPILQDDSYYRITARPDDQEEFARLQEIMTLARDGNLKARTFPYLDHGLDFSAYTLRLFHFSQSGLLVLAALMLGILSARIPEGPLLRKAGTWRILLGRIAALLVTALAVLILPRAAASLFMAFRHGWGDLDLIVPFNPRAGYPLNAEIQAETLTLIGAPLRAIRADSLIRLGPAFLLMYVYETAQLFLWLSLGLLFGSLSRRRFFAFGLPLSFLLLGQITAPLLQSQLAGLMFPVYQDAVRDVLGSGSMLRGFMTSEIPPQDYTTGLAVMVISGLAALYLADLKGKSLHRTRRKGGADETL